VKVIRFIKRAQQLGFTLAQVGELLKLQQDRTGSCARVRASAQTKIEEIDAKIESLRAMKSALAELVDCCSQEDTIRECLLLESLDQPCSTSSPAALNATACTDPPRAEGERL
jgi:hypothetical protein